jgi:peptidoglycan DL-endopeptidase CwlO
VKRKLCLVILVAVTITMSAALSRATEEKEETLGDKLKKLFVRPAPTPTPRKHRKQPSPSATASPTETPASSIAPSPQESTAANPSATETPSSMAEPTGSVETLAPVQAESAQPQPQYFEPVRPISPGPRSRPRPPSRVIHAPETTPMSRETPASEMASTPTETPESRPTPSLPPMVKQPSPPVEKKAAASNATVSIAEISESPKFSAELEKLIDLGLNLAAQNLAYKYASADPANGGMDCSGFIYYVLTKFGIKDAPRDAREQYIWVRKAGNFQAVLAQRDDTFEFDSLKPGDLLFWASNFGVSRDPEITQTMIYIGRDKATNQRLMVGASERGTFKNATKSGVGVFDFNVGRAAQKADKETSAVFVGYGRIPGFPLE